MGLELDFTNNISHTVYRPIAAASIKTIIRWRADKISAFSVSQNLYGL